MRHQRAERGEQHRPAADLVREPAREQQRGQHAERVRRVDQREHDRREAPQLAVGARRGARECRRRTARGRSPPRRGRRRGGGSTCAWVRLTYSAWSRQRSRVEFCCRTQLSCSRRGLPLDGHRELLARPRGRARRPAVGRADPARGRVGRPALQRHARAHGRLEVGPERAPGPPGRARRARAPRLSGAGPAPALRVPPHGEGQGPLSRCSPRCASGATSTSSGPEGPQSVITHDGCGARVHVKLLCEEGHEVGPDDLRRDPGPGARAARRNFFAGAMSFRSARSLSGHEDARPTQRG